MVNESQGERIHRAFDEYAERCPRVSRRCSLGATPRGARTRPRRRGPRKGHPTEHQEQVVLVARVRAFYPDVIIAAVPNGGLRDKIVAAQLKAEGVKKAFPDLLIAEPRGSYHGAYIEMKRIGGKVRKDQAKLHQELRDRDYRVIVGYGAEDAWTKLEAYLAINPDLEPGEPHGWVPRTQGTGETSALD